MANDYAAQLSLQLKGHPANETLYVMDVKGSMAMSDFYIFTVTFISTNLNWTAQQLLNTPATLNFLQAQGATEPKVMGVITSFTIQDILFANVTDITDGQDYTVYTIAISPAAQVLLNTPRTQVFVGKTIPEIIEIIYKLNKISYNMQLDLTASSLPNSALLTKQHPFILQFEETDANFVARLLAKTGLVYYFSFTSSDEHELLIVTDTSISAQYSTKKGAGLPINPYVNQALNYLYVSEANKVIPLGNDNLGTFYHINIKNVPVPKTYTVFGDNYIYIKPPQSHSTFTPDSKSTTVFTHGTLQLWDETLTTGHTARYAELLRDTNLWQSCIYNFSVYSSLIIPAYGVFLKFPTEYSNSYTKINGDDLATSPLTVINVNYDISVGQGVLNSLGARIQWTNGEARMVCAVNAISGSLAYCKPITTNVPKITGYIPAIIAGEQSVGTVQVDQYGYYQLSLPVNQAQQLQNIGSVGKMETSLYNTEGFFTPLVIGTVVLLGFQNGNPDVPLIVGATPNVSQSGLATVNNPTHAGLILNTKQSVSDEQSTSTLTTKGHSVPTDHQTISQDTWKQGTYSMVHSGEPGSETLAVNYPNGSTTQATGNQTTQFTATPVSVIIDGCSGTLTQGDAVSEVTGNNISQTDGFYLQTVKGNFTQINESNSYNTTMGDSFAYNYGACSTINYSTVNNLTTGSAQNTTIGTETNVNIGASNSLYVGEVANIILAANTTVTIGVNIEANIAPTIEIKSGGRFHTNLENTEVTWTAKTDTSGIGHFKTAPVIENNSAMHNSNSGIINQNAGMHVTDGGMCTINTGMTTIDSGMVMINGGLVMIN